MPVKNVIVCHIREAYSYCSPLQFERRGNEQPIFPFKAVHPCNVGGEHLHLQEHWDGAVRVLVGKAHRGMLFLLHAACCRSSSSQPAQPPPSPSETLVLEALFTLLE